MENNPERLSGTGPDLESGPVAESGPEGSESESMSPHQDETGAASEIGSKIGGEGQPEPPAEQPQSTVAEEGDSLPNPAETEIPEEPSPPVDEDAVSGEGGSEEPDAAAAEEQPPASRAEQDSAQGLPDSGGSEAGAKFEAKPQIDESVTEREPEVEPEGPEPEPEEALDVAPEKPGAGPEQPERDTPQQTEAAVTSGDEGEQPDPTAAEEDSAGQLDPEAKQTVPRSPETPPETPLEQAETSSKHEEVGPKEAEVKWPEFKSFREVMEYFKSKRTNEVVAFVVDVLEGRQKVPDFRPDDDAVWLLKLVQGRDYSGDLEWAAVALQVPRLRKRVQEGLLSPAQAAEALARFEESFFVEPRSVGPSAWPGLVGRKRPITQDFAKFSELPEGSREAKWVQMLAEDPVALFEKEGSVTPFRENLERLMEKKVPETILGYIAQVLQEETKESFRMSLDDKKWLERLSLEGKLTKAQRWGAVMLMVPAIKELMAQEGWSPMEAARQWRAWEKELLGDNSASQGGLLRTMRTDVISSADDVLYLAYRAAYRPWELFDPNIRPEYSSLADVVEELNLMSPEQVVIFVEDVLRQRRAMPIPPLTFKVVERGEERYLHPPREWERVKEDIKDNPLAKWATLILMLDTSRRIILGYSLEGMGADELAKNIEFELDYWWRRRAEALFPGENVEDILQEALTKLANDPRIPAAGKVLLQRAATDLESLLKPTPEELALFGVASPAEEEEE